MRTTVTLDDELLREAKLAAAESGRTLTALIEEALREPLRRRAQTGARERIVLPTSRGRLRPGINLDDTAAPLDLMDAPDAPPRR